MVFDVVERQKSVLAVAKLDLPADSKSICREKWVSGVLQQSLDQFYRALASDGESGLPTLSFLWTY